MTHIHTTAIAPMALPWETTIQLRRNTRRLWATAQFGEANPERIGAEGALFLDDALFRNFETSNSFALDAARSLRRNDALWFPFTGHDAKLFDDFLTKHGLNGTLTAHVVLTRTGTLSLIVSFNFPRTPERPSFDQRDLRRVFERVFLADGIVGKLDSFVRNTVLRPFFENEAPAPSAPRADATHLVTILRGAEPHVIDAFRRAHAEEEGTADSVREAAGQSADSIAFVRFGWSYTTLAVPGYSKEIMLLPLMNVIQNLWFAQKSLREQVGYFVYEDLGIKRERTIAVELEALNIERTFVANEIEDFRSNLKPWLASAFDFVFAKWGLAETRTNVEQIIGNLREYYERKLGVYDSRQAKRQASVLFWIALLQCTQMFANLAGYFYFLDLSDIDVSGVTTSRLFFLALVVSPIVMTVLSVFTAWLYFADHKPSR